MIPSRRRGACPSLAAPMQTGDGLLARLNPGGRTIPLNAAISLCAAARRLGNGIIEVTSRGSIQVRGLSAASAAVFADTVLTLDLDVADGIPVRASPLAGLESSEAINAVAVAAALREAIRAAGLRGRLAPKVSVAVDGGGGLHLDALAADLRLRADAGSGGALFHVLLGGTAASANHIGAVAPGDAVETAVRLLDVLAARGLKARAHSVIECEGADPFHTAVADLLIASPVPPPRRHAEPIGPHPLRNGKLALGIGLAFGHTDVDALERLLESASRVRASGIRTAPDRALLVVGIEPKDLGLMVMLAEMLGFVTRASDPRRAVAACPGAPHCASTDLPTRAVAPAITAAAAPILNGSIAVHLSGCSKGCAHQGDAAMTLVGMDGRCGIVANGDAQARPLTTLTPDALPARLAQLAQTCAAQRLPDEDTAAVLSRLGTAKIAALLEEGAHE